MKVMEIINTNSYLFNPIYAVYEEEKEIVYVFYNSLDLLLFLSNGKDYSLYQVDEEDIDLYDDKIESIFMNIDNDLNDIRKKNFFSLLKIAKLVV